jgi:hypothetical protein
VPSETNAPQRVSQDRAITAEMRDLLTEIRNLLAERLEEEEGAEAQPEEGVEAVILAETRENEDL